MPSGASSCHFTSDGLGAMGFSLPMTLWCVPSRLRRKYSLPLAEEPMRLLRHSTRVRGQFSGASTSSIAEVSEPSCRAPATYAAGLAAVPASTAAWASSATWSGLVPNCG